MGEDRSRITAQIGIVPADFIKKFPTLTLWEIYGFKEDFLEARMGVLGAAGETPERVTNIVKILANPRNPLAKRHPSHLELRTSVAGHEHRWLAEDIERTSRVRFQASSPCRYEFIGMGDPGRPMTKRR